MVFFQDSNLIDKNPIWPLLNQREKLHKSKGPILTKNNGSFELDNLTSDIITKNIKSGILMTVLSLVSKKKKTSYWRHYYLCYFNIISSIFHT